MRIYKRIFAILMFVIVALIMPVTPPAEVDIGIDNTGIAYAGTIPVDKAHFPDEAFRAFLAKQYGSSIDPSVVTTMYVYDPATKSLEGIQYFTALKELNCSYINNLGSLDVSHNTSLESLICRDNNLSSLDVSHNTALKELDCGMNKLSSLDVSHNTALVQLDCSSNNLSSLDVRNSTALEYLNCSDNNLGKLYLSKTLSENSFFHDDGVEIIYGSPSDPVKPVTLNTASAKVAVGKSTTLEAFGPNDIAFKSSNKAVATVSSTGKVSAVKPGTATITAYSKADKTNKATCKITVKYKLTYKMDGGTNSDDNPTWYTGKVTLKDPKTRKGYDFKGWYSDSNFKTRVRTVTNANKTLYAKWEWHSYSIKFVKNGGTGSLYYQRCRYGKEFNLPECHYTRKGYTFTGWNTKADGSGKAYADRASFKNLTSEDGKTISFYAQWKVRKYTIKYSGLPEGAKNDNKTSYTINTATFSLKDASCPGYTFKGWFSDSKKTKPITSIAKGSTGSKTIYSKWTAHNYTIKFNANGGEGTTAAMKSCVYGKQYNLTKNGFQKKDSMFTGWNTQADGSGASYADGAAVSNLVTKNGGSITLYAQWEEDKYLLYWPVRNGTTNVTELSSNCYYYLDKDKNKVWIHKGIDIANSAGASWYAAKGGTIYRVYTGCNTDANGTHDGEAGSCNPDYGYYGFTFYDAAEKPYIKNICNNGFGNGIVIQTDPIDGVTYYIQYAHMESVAFTKENEGQRITAGTYLGKVGNRGFSFGTHAHFEINKDKLFGNVVDNDYTHTEALAGEHDKCVFTYKYDW